MGQGSSVLSSREKMYLWGFQEYTLHETNHNQICEGVPNLGAAAAPGPSSEHMRIAVSEAFTRVQQRHRFGRSQHEGGSDTDDVVGADGLEHTTQGISGARSASPSQEGSSSPLGVVSAAPDGDSIISSKDDPSSPKAIAMRMHMTVGATSRALLEALAECSPNRGGAKRAAPSGGGTAGPPLLPRKREMPHQRTTLQDLDTTKLADAESPTFNSTAASFYARNRQRRPTEPFPDPQCWGGSVSSVPLYDDSESHFTSDPMHKQEKARLATRRASSTSTFNSWGSLQRDVDLDADDSSDEDDDVEGIRNAVSRATKGPLPLHPAVVPRPTSLLGLVLMTFDTKRQSEHRSQVQASLKASLLHDVATCVDFSNKGLCLADFRLMNYILLNRRVFSVRQTSLLERGAAKANPLSLRAQFLEVENAEPAAVAAEEEEEAVNHHKLLALHVAEIDLSSNPLFGPAGVKELTRSHSPLTSPATSPGTVLQASRFATAVYGGVATFLTRLDLSRCNIGDAGAIQIAHALLGEAKPGSMICVNRYEDPMKTGSDLPFPLGDVKDRHEPYSRLHHGFTPLLPRLEELVLDYNDIGDAGFVAICEAVRVLFHTSAQEHSRAVKHITRHMGQRRSSSSISPSASRDASSLAISHEMSPVRMSDETPKKRNKEHNCSKKDEPLWAQSFNSPICFDHDSNYLGSPAPLIGDHGPTGATKHTARQAPPVGLFSQLRRSTFPNDPAWLARKASATVGTYIASALHSDVSLPADYENTLLRRINAHVTLRRISVRNNKITDASCEALSAILETRRVVPQFTSLAQAVVALGRTGAVDLGQVDELDSTIRQMYADNIPHKVVALQSVDTTGNSLGNEGILRVCDALVGRIGPASCGGLPISPWAAGDEASSGASSSEPCHVAPLELRFSGNHITHQGVGFLQSAIDDANEATTLSHLGTLELLDERLQCLKRDLQAANEDAASRINGMDAAFEQQQRNVNAMHCTTTTKTPTRRGKNSSRRGDGGVSQQEMLRQRLQLDKQRERNDEQRGRIRAELEDYHRRAVQHLFKTSIHSIHSSASLSGHITILDLSHCHLGDSGLESLLGLISDLSETSSLLAAFGTDALNNIRGIAPPTLGPQLRGSSGLHQRHFPHPLLYLRELNLSNCGFTAYALPALCGVFNCQSRLPQQSRLQGHRAEQTSLHHHDASTDNINQLPSASPHLSACSAPRTFLDAPLVQQESVSAFAPSNHQTPASAILSRNKSLAAFGKSFGAKSMGLGQTFRGAALAALHQQKMLQQHRANSVQEGSPLLGAFVAFQHSESNLSGVHQPVGNGGSNDATPHMTRTNTAMPFVDSRRNTAVCGADFSGFNHPLGDQIQTPDDSHPPHCCTCALPYLTSLNLAGNSLGVGFANSCRGQHSKGNGSPSGKTFTNTDSSRNILGASAQALMASFTGVRDGGSAGMVFSAGDVVDSDSDDCSRMLASLFTHALNVGSPQHCSNSKSASATAVHIDLSRCRLGPQVAVDATRNLVEAHRDLIGLACSHPQGPRPATACPNASPLLQLSLSLTGNELTHFAILILRDTMNLVAAGCNHVALMDGGASSVPAVSPISCDVLDNIVVVPNEERTSKTNRVRRADGTRVGLDWRNLRSDVNGATDDHLIPILHEIARAPSSSPPPDDSLVYGPQGGKSCIKCPAAFSRLPFSEKAVCVVEPHSGSRAGEGCVNASPARPGTSLGRMSYLTSGDASRDRSELLEECSPHSIRLDPSEHFSTKMTLLSKIGGAAQVADDMATVIRQENVRITVTHASPRGPSPQLPGNGCASRDSSESSVFSGHVFSYDDDEDDATGANPDDVSCLRLPHYPGITIQANPQRAPSASNQSSQEPPSSSHLELEKLLSDADELMEEGSRSLAAMTFGSYQQSGEASARTLDEEAAQQTEPGTKIKVARLAAAADEENNPELAGKTSLNTADDASKGYQASPSKRPMKSTLTASPRTNRDAAAAPTKGGRKKKQVRQ